MALVISIILLLILAGVSINFIFGNDGIFTKTQMAVDKYKQAENEEQAYLNLIQNYVNDVYTIGNRYDTQGFFLGIESTPGDGTKSNPYIITTAEQLLGFAQMVDGGRNFKGEYIKLGGNIDLSGVCSVISEKSWIPIGYGDNSFQGNFDGNNKTISNLYINVTGSTLWGHGLFGVVSNEAVIENVTVEGNIKANAVVGGIVGAATNSNITNCTNRATISGDAANIGGIVGASDGAKIQNCSNQGNISSNNSIYASKVGGILGAINDTGSVATTITGCNYDSGTPVKEVGT